MAIKAQALADFIAEFTYDATPELEITPPEVELQKSRVRKMISPDGSSLLMGHPTSMAVVQDSFSKPL